MKRLKKLLAISLVLIMMMGMVPFAGATAQLNRVETIYDFVDFADIDKYEAVAVLTAIGVFRGIEGVDGTRFGPQEYFTRAQAAAVIARVNLAAHIANDLPAAPTGFPDVPATHWAARYVAFAVANGIIVGHPDGLFRPDDLVTGVQFAAMLLRSLGYGALGEFEGPVWDVHVITMARARQNQQAGLAGTAPWPILDGYANWVAPATREEVAFYALNAMRWTDVILGTYTGDGGVVEQRYNSRGTVLMTRVHQLTDPTRDDEFGRPFTHWLWVRPGTNVARPLNVDIPHAPAVQWTSRQTTAIVGAFVRDNPFSTPGQPVIARNLFENGRLDANAVSASLEIYNLTGNGIVVEVYVDADTGYIDRVVVVQTDLYRIQTVDAPTQRVTLEQTSNNHLPARLGTNFHVDYNEVGNNDMYDYVRALPAGTGGGSQVLVVAVWDAAEGDFVPHTIQRPTVIEGILSITNLEMFRLTFDDNVYSIAQARHNTMQGRAIPHPTNVATLMLDNFGFVVDVRTEPAPANPYNIVVLQTNLSIPRPGPGGTVISHPAIRAVNQLGNEIVIEAQLTGGADFVVGGIYSRVEQVGAVHHFSPLLTDNNTHTRGVILDDGVGVIPARSDRLTAAMQATTTFTNWFHGNVNYIYVWPGGPNETLTFQVRTGPQAQAIDIAAFAPATPAAGAVAAFTGAGGVATIQNVGTVANPDNVVRAIFIWDSPGAPHPSELIHVARVGNVYNTSLMGGIHVPGDPNLNVFRAWRGATAVTTNHGDDLRGLLVRGALEHSHRFYLYNEVDGVHSLWQVPETAFVSYARLDSITAVDNPARMVVSDAEAGIETGTFLVTGATVIDTRSAAERRDAPIAGGIAGLRAARNSGDFTEIRVSFAITDHVEPHAPIIFISGATAAEEAAPLPDGAAVFTPLTINAVREVPTRQTITITLEEGYTFAQGLHFDMAGVLGWFETTPAGYATFTQVPTGTAAGELPLAQQFVLSNNNRTATIVLYVVADDIGPGGTSTEQAAPGMSIVAEIPAAAIVGRTDPLAVSNFISFNINPVTVTATPAAGIVRPFASTENQNITVTVTGDTFNNVWLTANAGIVLIPANAALGIGSTTVGDIIALAATGTSTSFVLEVDILAIAGVNDGPVDLTIPAGAFTNRSAPLIISIDVDRT